jgi:hypothetical protein
VSAERGFFAGGEGGFRTAIFVIYFLASKIALTKKGSFV